ncbi:MAG TPA: dihydrofolate reductase family protein [Lentimicrobium sp.]|nr:dihydrofolate reductase family protein [Lentimicrobium sp.]
MRKLVGGINITLDGYCDHTAVIADDELHQHYNELLKTADTMLFGRTTYQLMESHWPALIENPTGNGPMDEFAGLIDNISKIVYSKSLSGVDWKNTQLKRDILKEEILELKQQPGKDILAGSRSMIVELIDLGLIDELQLTVHPILLGNGLPLFDKIRQRVDLKLLRTKTFTSGALTLYYEPINSSI